MLAQGRRRLRGEASGRRGLDEWLGEVEGGDRQGGEEDTARQTLGRR